VGKGDSLMFRFLTAGAYNIRHGVHALTGAMPGRCRAGDGQQSSLAILCSGFKNLFFCNSTLHFCIPVTFVDFGKIKTPPQSFVYVDAEEFERIL